MEENEIIEEDNLNTDSENIDSDNMDSPVTETESGSEMVQNELVDAVLREIAERALATTSGEEVAAETETTETETIEQTDYTDILDLIESDLYIIAENTTTSSGNTIYTPIKDYELTNILLLAILIVMMLRIGVEVIKNNVFKLN